MSAIGGLKRSFSVSYRPKYSTIEDTEAEDIVEDNSAAQLRRREELLKTILAQNRRSIQQHQLSGGSNLRRSDSFTPGIANVFAPLDLIVVLATLSDLY